VLRRSGGVPAFCLPSLDLGSIALDPSTRSVTLGDRPTVRLTQLEFRLLYTLMTHRGQVIPWEVIVERVWGYSGGGSRELVRGLVSRLRSKIEPDPSTPGFVHTIPGVGYIFDIETA
jgi:DNA-binding response OmpR family regulator